MPTGQPFSAGAEGDYYSNPLTVNQLLGESSVMSGSSIGLQAWYQTPGLQSAFSEAIAIVVGP